MGKRWCLIFVAVAALLAPPHAHAAAGKRPDLVIGYIASSGSLGASATEQMLTLMKAIAEAFSKESGIRVTVRDFPKAAPAEEAVRNYEVDILLNDRAVARRSGFEPFMVLSIMNERTFQYCLLARKGHKFKSLADVKGKRLAISKGDISNGVLWHALGASPLDYFSKVVGTRNDTEPAHAVKLNEADVAWVNWWVYLFTKKANPGSVKGLERVYCATVCPQLTYISPKVSKELVAKARQYFANLDTAPGLKRYRSLIKQVGLDYTPHTPEDEVVCKAHRTMQNTWMDSPDRKRYKQWRQTIGL